MDDTEDETQIIFTHPEDEDKWTTRVAAKRMVKAILQDTIQKRCSTFEGDLTLALPLTHTMHGMKYKLVFKGVPPSMMEDLVLPALRDRGFAEVISKDDVAQQRMKKEEFNLLKKKNRKSIGDFGMASDLISRLEKLRGTGGSEASRRKFSDACIDLAARSSRIATAGMTEFQADEHAQGAVK